MVEKWSSIRTLDKQNPTSARLQFHRFTFLFSQSIFRPVLETFFKFCFFLSLLFYSVVLGFKLAERCGFLLIGFPSKIFQKITEF